MSELVQKTIDKFLMNLDLKDGGISLPLYQAGAREKAFMSILRETVNPGDVCVDLGANIGYTTLFMLDRVGSDGFVYAIEPDQHNIDLLQANITSNNFSDIVSVDKCAISDEDGTLDFWIASQPNLNSVKKTKHSIRKEEIPCFTLKSFLEDKKYPNFIKMDVEGHEVLFRLNGYVPARTVYTDGFMRGVYTDIENDDMIEFTCKPHHEAGSKKIARSFMITREE